MCYLHTRLKTYATPYRDCYHDEQSESGDILEYGAGLAVRPGTQPLGLWRVLPQYDCRHYEECDNDGISTNFHSGTLSQRRQIEFC